MQSEPARIAAIVGAFIAAVIALGVAFGLPVSPAQRDAILATILPTIAFIVLMGEVIRSKVYAPDTTRDLQVEAYNDGRAGKPLPTLAAPPAK